MTFQLRQPKPATLILTAPNRLTGVFHLKIQKSDRSKQCYTETVETGASARKSASATIARPYHMAIPVHGRITQNFDTANMML